LIEAARLIATNDRSQDHWHSYYFGHSSHFDKEGEFKEKKLIGSWIKDVFNPWQMLNLFLTVVSNVKESSKKTPKLKGNENIRQGIALHEYHAYYGELAISPFMTILSDVKKNGRRKGNKVTIPAPTTLDLALHRGMSIHNSHYRNNKSTLGSLMDKNINQIFKLLIDYGNQDKLLYELDNGKVLKLKKILEKNYPAFFRQLQKTDEYFYSKYPS
jgi:uncharacterized protein YpbB